MHPQTNGSGRGRIAVFSLFLAAAFLGVATRTQAVEPVGDDAELFITGVFTAAQNDNIFLSHSTATSAMVVDLVPGLSYEAGKNNSLTKWQAAYYQDLQFFSKEGSQLNNSLGNFVFLTRYDDSKTKFNMDATWHQMDQAEVGLQNVGFLVNRDLYHADMTGEMQLTEKSAIGTGVIFDAIDYKAAGYDSYRYIEVPLNYYFKFEPKLDLSAGVRYRQNTVGGSGINSNDWYYNVGARGEFTPKLTGQFDVGYLYRGFDNGTSAKGLGANANFTYVFDPKASVNFGVGDDYTYFPTGLPVRNMSATLGVTTALDSQWSINYQLGYNRYTYITTAQRDDYYSARIGVTYTVATYLTLTASYAYTKDSSNVLSYNFSNNIFSISASLHY